MVYKPAKNGLVIALICGVSVLIASCDQTPESSDNAKTSTRGTHAVLGGVQTPLFEFNDGLLPEGVSAMGSDIQLVSQGDGSALRVQFDAKNNYTVSVNFAPETIWDWSGKENFGIAFDISNPGAHSTQLHFNISTADGRGLTRAMVVPVGATRTYYAELKSSLMALDSGLRGDPPTIQGGAEWFVWMWGDKNLNYSNVTNFGFYSRGLKHNREIIIDNVRLVENPPLDTEFLTEIVDEYGQARKVNFKGKIHSDEDLLAATQAELELLSKEPEFFDRTQYGGWKKGPKLKATGYFRTEKVGKRWAIIDPEGYLFFSTGIANIRLSNNGTITGYQYDKSDVVQRTPEDLTPEHSVGLNLVDMPGMKSRRLESALRKEMYAWLPEAGEKYDGNYGYRREVNVGPLEHGETFSFYRANLERKYSKQYPDFMEKWSEVAINRLRHWGFTSTGNWADHSLYDNNKVPYFADGWIIGDYKTVNSGFDFWGAIPDPFDTKFVDRAELTVRDIAQRVKDNPWCIGVFIDNEISWGRSETKNATYGVVINTLSRDAAATPAKFEFMRLLREKYSGIAALNAAWATDFESWDTFAAGAEFDSRNGAVWSDFSMLLEAFASEYFRVVHDALETHMPNHMYMGARLSSWGRPIEVIRAAAKYNDVISYNEYREFMHPAKWEHLEEIDKPGIIGEWHVGAIDRGAYHAGIVWAADQADRGRMYEEYMQSVLDNPYIVGAHWFQYTDSELTGRAMDGENYNVGYVSVADIPYPELIESTKKVNRTLYENAFGNWIANADARP
ncbi:MAG: beta-galactosidase [Woeseiaceae bacterium]